MERLHGASFDQDCASVLEKFPAPLKDRIQAIIAQKSSVAAVTDTTNHIENVKKCGGVPVEPPLARRDAAASQEKTNMLSRNRNASQVTSGERNISQAEKLTPKSKREHVSRLLTMASSECDVPTSTPATGRSKNFAATKAGVHTVLARREAREGAGAKKLKELSARPQTAVTPHSPPPPAAVPGLQRKRSTRGLKEVDANSAARPPAATGVGGAWDQQLRDDDDLVEWSTNPVEAMKTYQNSLRCSHSVTEATAEPKATTKKRVIRSSAASKAAFDKFIHRRDAAKAKHDEKYRPEKDWGSKYRSRDNKGGAKNSKATARRRTPLPDMVM